MNPRKAFIVIRVSENEARHLLELVESIDKRDELAPPGWVKACERISYRIRKAKVRFPKR